MKREKLKRENGEGRRWWTEGLKKMKRWVILMCFLKGVELSLYRERIQESVATSRPTCFRPTSQLRGNVLKSRRTRHASAKEEHHYSTFEGQGSAFPVMRPWSRVERAMSAKISISSSLYYTSEISSNGIENLGFSTHNLISVSHTLFFVFILLY